MLTGLVRMERAAVSRGQIVVAVALVVVVVALVARRPIEPTSTGAGDDKPPGYENPTPQDVAISSNP